MNLPHDKQGAASPQQWLAHAQSDLRLARLAEKSDILPEQICFHAQQAVEKAFKAVLLHRKINFPLTHDLEELLAVFERAGLAVPSEFEGVGALTPYAVETRYPGFWGEILDSDLAEALDFAERVLAWALKEINQ
jgi:HEPN domain-containing protein